MGDETIVSLIRIKTDVELGSICWDRIFIGKITENGIIHTI